MLSIIIAFGKGKEYLKDCFDSIKEQDYKDIETVLVLDKANINPEENIEELISEFSQSINLKVYETGDNSGVSAARNLGLLKANGEYVYFLDSDDYLMEDTLTGLMKTMDENKDLTYGRIFHTWFKKAAFNVDQGDVIDDGSEQEVDSKVNNDDNFNFSEINDYKLKNFANLSEITVLGTVFKKKFLTDNNIKFNEEQKYYSDPEFWTKVLMNVKNYGCNKDSIYVKRYHNDKINLPSISQMEDDRKDAHFVQSFLDCMKLSESKNDIRNHFEKMACDYYVKVFSRKFHDNSADKESIDFALMSSMVKECGKRTISKYGFVEKKILKNATDYNMEKVKKWSNIRLIKRKLVMMLTSKKHMYRTINLYVFGKMKQKDNWIVFESFVGRNYSGQPKYIYRYLQKNYGSKFKYIWVVNDKNLVIDGNCKKIKRFGLKYYYYMTRSKYWVNNMRQPHAYPKRDSQIMLETWHGTPLKKLVFDMDDVHSANPKYKQIVYKQSRKWDYLLSDNPFSTEKFQSCFMYEKDKILELGYPANDPLYDKDLDKKADELKTKLGIPKNKKVLLYAPTWRDDNSYGAGEYKFELALDLKRLKEEIGDEYVILLRMHYWIVDKLDLTGMSDFVINVSNYSDITDIYIVSDICMTDYSSVFFDYANLKRPILYYMYDLEKYRDVLRGFYLDIEKELPGPILQTNDEVIDAIKNIDKVNEEYKDKYQEFYNRFCCIDDGNAAKRVCEKVFGVK